MNEFSAFVSRNKPGLVMGLGLASMVLSAFAAWRYSPMARDAIEERKQELGVDRLEPMDTIKTAGPYVVPTLVFGAVGVGCVLGANKMNLDRGAAMAAAYAISETSLRNYREHTREIVGEKKEKEIREEIAKDSYKEAEKNNKVLVLSNGSGDFWIYDELTRQRFKSTVQKVHDAIIRLNYKQIHEGPISVNEYCSEMEEENIEFGDAIGWDINRNGLIKIYSPTATVMDNGEPCIIITHEVGPVDLF